MRCCRLLVPLVAFALLALYAATASAAPPSVVVQKRQPVQIALVIPSDAGIQDLAVGIRNGVHLAVEAHRVIRGYAVQLLEYAVTCANAPAENAALAQALVSSPQVVAVIGHTCSASFGNVVTPASPGCAPLTIDSSPSALSIYEAAGVVTINGSTSHSCLPLVGPTVFNSTFAAEPAGSDSWYGAVKTLPSDTAWRAAYASAFGIAASDFSDTYYDAASLLLKTLTKVSHPSGHTLVIERHKLAAAVRGTTQYCGVTGRVALDAGGFRIPDAVACNG
jgi:ABC-type branched-subunit amino acid transport system substrate-binding protein